MTGKFPKTQGVVHVQVEVLQFQENGIWVSYCPALELSSYGETPEEAKAAFDEAMEIFLEETNRKGTLERHLLKLGWKLQQKPKVLYDLPRQTLREQSRLLRKKPDIYKEQVALPI